MFRRSSQGGEKSNDRPSARRSLLDTILRRNSGQLDENWTVGSRYEVVKTTPMYNNPRMTGDQDDELKPKDVVLLLQTQISSGQVVGLVSPCNDGDRRGIGWVLLEALPSGQTTATIRRQRLPGSWVERARYQVKHPATMRASVLMDSPLVCELQPGAEVLILEIGVHFEPDGDLSQTRLRLKASYDEKDCVGWLSPETSGGNKLLDPVNLLGEDAIKIHRTSVLNNSPAAGIMRRLSQENDAGSGGISAATLNAIPWQVEGKYRVLEKVKMKRSAEKKSKKLGQLPVGCFVTISEIQLIECKSLGWCPCAFVSASASSKANVKIKEKKGWIRCAAKDGRNLIDTRDQDQFEKVQRRLKQQSGDLMQADRGTEKKVTWSNNPPEQRAVVNRAGEHHEAGEDSDDESYDEADYEDWDDEESEEESGSDAQGASDEATVQGASDEEQEPPEKHPGGALLDEPKLPAGVKQLSPEEEQLQKERDFTKKLQNMEIGAKEEKMVEDKTIITDDQWCGCNCGAA